MSGGIESGMVKELIFTPHCMLLVSFWPDVHLSIYNAGFFVSTVVFFGDCYVGVLLDKLRFYFSFLKNL